MFAGLSLALPAQKAHAQNLNSLVAFYAFDAQNANNTSPRTSGYNGTLSNVTFSNAVMRDGSGYSAVFNGTSSSIATSLDIQSSALPNNTIGGWFYLTGTSGTSVQELVSGDSGGYGRGIDIDARSGTNSPSGSLQWSAFGGNQGVVQSGANVATGAWHFIASTYNSSTSILTLDVDGAMTTKTGVNFGTSTAKLGIGYNPGLGSEFFNGYADDVFVYNTVLTNSDLNTIQSGGRTAIINGAAAPEPVSAGLALWGLLPTAALLARRRFKA